jgi:hypothetical protein
MERGHPARTARHILAWYRTGSGSDRVQLAIEYLSSTRLLSQAVPYRVIYG